MTAQAANPSLYELNSTAPVDAANSSTALISVGATAAAITSTATCREVWLVAPETNALPVYLGWANTITTSGSTSGVPLYPGERRGYAVADPSLIFAIADDAAQTLHVEVLA